MSKIIRAPHLAQRQGGYVFKMDIALVLAARWCRTSGTALGVLSIDQHPVMRLARTISHALQQPVPVRS